mgnify:CR=1 FL=1
MFKNQRGGAAVEFAIVLPLLALILFGTIDFALLFYNKQVITNASREGARAAIVADNWLQNSSGVPITSDITAFKIIVVAYCSNRLISLGGANDLDPDLIGVVDYDPVNYITVTVPYDYKHLLSGITGFSNTRLTGKTVMRPEWL